MINSSKGISTERLKRLASNTRIVSIFVLLIVVIAVISIVAYIRTQQAKPSKNANRMEEILKNNPPKMSSFNVDNAEYKHKLRDYRILTSFNSCCGGSKINDYVSKEALENVIRMGARCLDFEIYNVNNMPVVAASTEKSVFIKQTYNSLPFAEVMKMVGEMAFANRYAPNHREPLFINLRIKSNQREIYDQIAKDIQQSIGKYLLPARFGNENRGEDLGKDALAAFMNSAIIIVDVANPIYRETKLEELINIGANSPFLRMEHSRDVVFTHNYHNNIEYNKKHISYCIPNLKSNENEHMDFKWKCGIQMIGLEFQHNDTGFKYIYSKFQGKHGFLLKDKALRFIPNTIEEPKKQSKDLSYRPKQVKGNGYTITI
jgi:hypothetical protein